MSTEAMRTALAELVAEIQGGGVTDPTLRKARAALAQQADEPVASTVWTEFDAWWDIKGSGICPLPEHDMEEHAKRVAEVAWFTQNGIGLPDGNLRVVVKDSRVVEWAVRGRK